MKVSEIEEENCSNDEELELGYVKDKLKGE